MCSGFWNCYEQLHSKKFVAKFRSWSFSISVLSLWFDPFRIDLNDFGFMSPFFAVLNFRAEQECDTTFRSLICLYC